MSASAPRRALVVGVQHPLDPKYPRRPGTCAALRRIEASLRLGGWTVRSLLDDASEDAGRPLFSNLLEGLHWLRGGGQALLVASAPVVDGRLVPRDGRGPRTTLSLEELVAELPPGAHCWLDGAPAVPAGALAGWVAGVPGPEGSDLLRALAGTLIPGATPLSAAAFAAALAERTRATLAGSFPDPVLGAAGALTCEACGAPVPDARAAFCPSCGAGLAVEELLDNGRYRLVERLGAGGMGQVFLAEDTRLKVRRAIKLLAAPPDLPADERADLQARMVQEARAAQALSEDTPHVVRVFDVGVAAERGEPYLVMELLEGETLAARLAREPLPFGDALAIGRVVAGALAQAHARGFIHRDLKPDNIMLVRRAGEPPRVKLLDFGLVKASQAEVRTESGRMMGTLQYMPPEQLRGEAVDARADVFSLGAVLYECFSGRRANPGRTQGEIFGVLLASGVPPLASVAPTLPAPLTTLIDACLRLDRAERPAHAGVVAAALARIEVPAGEAPSVYALTLPSADVVPIPTEAGPAARPRRVGLVVAAAAVIGLGAWVALRPKSPVESDASVNPVVDSAAPVSSADAAAPAPPPADAAPPSAPPPAAATWPAEPEARPQVTRSRVGVGGQPGGAIRYLGAPSAAASAALRDLALGRGAPVLPDPEVEARWAEAPVALRAWLAAGTDPALPVAVEGGLEVPLGGFSPEAPSRRISNGFGTFWLHGARLPWVEAGRCRLQVGDRLFAARWSMPGYTGGQCSGGPCPEKLERALQKARSVGERLDAVLTVVRESDGAAQRGPGGEETDGPRIDLPCSVGP